MKNFAIIFTLTLVLANMNSIFGQTEWSKSVFNDPYDHSYRLGNTVVGDSDLSIPSAGILKVVSKKVSGSCKCEGGSRPVQIIASKVDKAFTIFENETLGDWQANENTVFQVGKGGRTFIGISQHQVGQIAPGAATSAMLYVNGRILSEEVKVDLSQNWPDYVFDKSYQLMPLNELEAYIAKESHLPGIPSAQEVAENEGFDLGEMSRKLLEKVEELSLYVIDLNKNLETMKKENEELQKEIASLRSN